jgi:hypothetical protein
MTKKIILNNKSSNPEVLLAAYKITGMRRSGVGGLLLVAMACLKQEPISNKIRVTFEEYNQRFINASRIEHKLHFSRTLYRVAHV